MQGFQESDRWFDVAIRVAREFAKSHIVASDRDCIAVVFYGTVRVMRCMPNMQKRIMQRT